MNPQMILAIGLLLNSALFLSGSFVAGLATGNDVALKLALAAIGLTYLGYAVQLMLPTAPRWIAGSIVALSIFAGALAGVALL